MDSEHRSLFTLIAWLFFTVIAAPGRHDDGTDTGRAVESGFHPAGGKLEPTGK
jgi:hypothetical protein